MLDPGSWVIERGWLHLNDASGPPLHRHNLGFRFMLGQGSSRVRVHITLLDSRPDPYLLYMGGIHDLLGGIERDMLQGARALQATDFSYAGPQPMLWQDEDECPYVKRILIFVRPGSPFALTLQRAQCQAAVILALADYVSPAPHFSVDWRRDG